MLLFVLGCSAALAQIPVKYQEGSLHGFLLLRAPDGKILATGDLVQRALGNRVTVRLTFHFKDGSLSDETAVYTQSRTFRLLTDRLIQKGPSFPHPVEVFVDTRKSQVTVHTQDDHGKPKVIEENMKLPPDLANGMISTLLKNIAADSGETKLSMLVATPKPRLVTLKIHAEEDANLTIGGTPRQATHFVVKVELGGVAGIVAPIIGKQPHDSDVWILKSEVPAFLKSESQFFQEAPLWTIELTSPTWPNENRERSQP